MAARMAMIEMTTRSSMSVKYFPGENILLLGSLDLALFIPPSCF
jgi:hypothetical protein